MALHGSHFTTDEHRSKIISTLRLRQMEDGLGFTGSVISGDKLPPLVRAAKVLINHWFIYGFLLHPLTQGRN